MRTSTSVFGLFFAALLTCQAGSAFVGLGDLDGGDYSSRAWSISADGNVIVGAAADEAGSKAVRWMVGAANVELQVLSENVATWALDVSGDGGLVLILDDSGETRLGSLWADSGQISIEMLTGGRARSAMALSDDGTTLVGTLTTPHAAFRWREDTGLVELGDLPGGEENSEALEVSPDGSGVVGSSLTANGREAFIWIDSQGMAALGDASGGQLRSYANCMSGDLSLVGGGVTSDFGLRAARWGSDFGWEVIDPARIPEGGSISTDMSDDGALIVGYKWMDQDSRAFVWTEATGLEPLDEVLERFGIDLSGWMLREAHGVSADGTRIVGVGINPAGEQEAWLATLDLVSDDDGDGLPNASETGTGVFVSPSDAGSDPMNADTDGDGLDDGKEVLNFGSDPNKADSDGDGYLDGFEVSTGFSPTASDSTPDTLSTVKTAVEFCFAAALGETYTVEASLDLENWEVIESGIEGTGGEVSRLYSVRDVPFRAFRARRE